MSPSTPPIKKSAENEVGVVSENEPASNSLNLASRPSTRLLVTASSLAGSKSLMLSTSSEEEYPVTSAMLSSLVVQNRR